MYEYDRFYKEELYPFQDGILSIVQNSGTDFYLTGGTALSRGHYNHRYSDDLDLFVNRSETFQQQVRILLSLLEIYSADLRYTIDYSKVRTFDAYTQVFLEKKSEHPFSLKIDLINDSVPNFGEIKTNPILGRIDSERNILSNKLSALFRYEPKDYVDILFIAKHNSFHWPEIIEEAKQKELSLEPTVLHDLFLDFPVNELSHIRWVCEPDFESVKMELSLLGKDIFFGRDNTLFRREGLAADGVD